LCRRAAARATLTTAQVGGRSRLDHLPWKPPSGSTEDSGKVKGRASRCLPGIAPTEPKKPETQELRSGVAASGDDRSDIDHELNIVSVVDGRHPPSQTMSSFPKSALLAIISYYSQASLVGILSCGCEASCLIGRSGSMNVRVHPHHRLCLSGAFQAWLTVGSS
jgi:hypothetical protein